MQCWTHCARDSFTCVHLLRPCNFLCRRQPASPLPPYCAHHSVTSRPAAECVAASLPHGRSNCMRRQAQSLLHKLRSAMTPWLTRGPRPQLTLAPRELATSSVRPRGAPLAERARHAAARRAGFGSRAEAQAGGSLPALHTGSGWPLAGRQTLALQARRPCARPQSTAAAVSAPASEAASADAPLTEAPPDVRVVDSLADAQDVVRRLLSLEDTGCPLYHAVDTEVCIAPLSRRLARSLTRATRRLVPPGV